MGIDIEYLFGEGIKLEHINEYKIAQMLDRLAEAKPNKVFRTAHSILQIFFKRLQDDTMSLSYYVRYLSDIEEKIVIRVSN